MAHYTAAKHGVLGLMKSLALELGPYNIRANALLTGPIHTPMADNPATLAGLFGSDRRDNRGLCKCHAPLLRAPRTCGAPTVGRRRRVDLARLGRGRECHRASSSCSTAGTASSRPSTRTRSSPIPPHETGRRSAKGVVVPVAALSTGLEMYYEESGDGEPLILHYGTGGDHAAWEPQVEELRQSSG